MTLVLTVTPLPPLPPLPPQVQPDAAVLETRGGQEADVLGDRSCVVTFLLGPAPRAHAARKAAFVNIENSFILIHAAPLILAASPASSSDSPVIPLCGGVGGVCHVEQVQSLAVCPSDRLTYSVFSCVSVMMSQC